MVEMVSRHSLGPTLLSLGKGWIFSLWINCFCLSAILWFDFLHWGFASVIEVVMLLTLRWLLTLGLISFFLRSSLSSPLGCLWWGGPLWNLVHSPIHVWSHWSTLYSCTLVVSTLHYFCLHRMVGILWGTPAGSPHVVRWEPSLAEGWHSSARASGALSKPSFFSPLSNSYNSTGNWEEDPCRHA